MVGVTVDGQSNQFDDGFGLRECQERVIEDVKGLFARFPEEAIATRIYADIVMTGWEGKDVPGAIGKLDFEGIKEKLYSGGRSLVADGQNVAALLEDLVKMNRPTGRQAGHFEITKEILGESAESGGGKYVVGWAVSPDIEFFDDLRFHAQSDNIDSSIFDCFLFEDLLRNHAIIVREAYQIIRKNGGAPAPKSITSQVLRSLGYFFHLVQDLVAHRGVTFIGHAFSTSKENPDRLSDSCRQLAVQLCEMSLEIGCKVNKSELQPFISSADCNDCLKPPNGGVCDVVWLLPRIISYSQRRRKVPRDTISPIEIEHRWYGLQPVPVDDDLRKIEKEITRIFAG